MDSSAERLGSEDCRDAGIGNKGDFMMCGSEDCCVGGNIVSEVCEVGGRIDSIVVEHCRHEDVSHMAMLQRTIEERRLCFAEFQCCRSTLQV